MAHIYEVGTRAWQPDPTEGWLASEVKDKLVDGDKVQLIFELENGEVRYQHRESGFSLLLTLTMGVVEH